MALKVLKTKTKKKKVEEIHHKIDSKKEGNKGS